MIKCLMLLASVVTTTVAQDTICSSLGDSVQCLTDPKDCAGGIWETESDVCGLCAGCRKYLDPGNVCQPDGPYSCSPGYHCLEDRTGVTHCQAKEGTCQHALNNNAHPSWTPRCDGDDYQAVQCKGEKPIGRCFCVSKDGTRLFGEQLWARADNMTCACSRRVEELRNSGSGRKDITLHCTPEGSYEKLQCDDGLCWCANETTGVPISRILPDTMVTILPCYNETEIGSQYLRQCESLMIAHGQIEMEMAHHHTFNPNFPYTDCDLDGSYGPVQLDGNRLFCAWKDKSAIESYAAEMSGLIGMTCRCARDKKMYTNVQMECQGNGNYNTIQYTNNGEKYCVDADGFLDEADKC